MFCPLHGSPMKLISCNQAAGGGKSIDLYERTSIRPSKCAWEYKYDNCLFNQLTLRPEPEEDNGKDSEDT